jgi:hypothetical protein
MIPLRNPVKKQKMNKTIHKVSLLFTASMNIISQKMKLMIKRIMMTVPRPRIQPIKLMTILYRKKYINLMKISLSVYLVVVVVVLKYHQPFLMIDRKHKHEVPQVHSVKPFHILA